MSKSTVGLEPALLRIEEAAEYLALSRAKLYTLLEPHGSIPVVKLGRSVRIPLDGLRRWVAEEAAAGQSGLDS
jgi:excisionase family DNA binding protein